jgi:hypothetical protein
VIDHEEARAVGMEAGVAKGFNMGTGKKDNPAAEAALKPVVFTRIEENPQKHERRGGDKEMQQA